MTLLKADSFTDPNGSIVRTALSLADASLVKLQAGDDVQISLDGMRGLPSSFYNTLLLRLIQALGVEAVRRRVTFQFDSNPQREMYQKSLDAVTKSVA